MQKIIAAACAALTLMAPAAFGQSISQPLGCIAGAACQASTMAVGGASGGADALAVAGTSSLGGALIVTSGNIQTLSGNIASSFSVLANSSIYPSGVTKAYIVSPADGTTQVQKSSGGQLSVSGLPNCTSGLDGSRGYVTDSSVSASGNFGATFSGGGSNHVPVYCDGNSMVWRIG